MVCLDSKIHVRKIPETMNREPRPRKQCQRKSELADDENTSQKMLARAGARAPAFLQCLSGINARCIPCGCGTCQNTGHGRGEQREQQDGNIEPEIGLARKRVARHSSDQALQHGVAHANSECASSAGKDLPAVLLSVASSPFIWLGLGIYGASVLAWLWVLSKTDVSVAYPFVGISFVLTAVMGAVLLHENVSVLRIVGTALVIFGCILIAKSA